MEGLKEYLVPYLISQAVSLVILIAAWKRTRWARWLFFVLFLWASGINMYLGLTDPDSYLDNARLQSIVPGFYQWMVQSLQSYYHTPDRSWTIFYSDRHVTT
jgi:hypothetical protein